MKISLTNLCKAVGVDRLAARRLIQRHLDVIPDKEGYIPLEDAKYYLQYLIDSSPSGDQRLKATEVLKRLKSPLSQDWIASMGLGSESEPTIHEAETETEKDVQEEEVEQEETEEEIFTTSNHHNMKDHIGLRILKDAWTAMFFTLFALLGQAYLFAHLAHRVFDSISVPAPFWFHFGIAIIFESTGILIASSFNDRKIGDDLSARSIWLTVFFIIQVVSDLCLFGVIKNPTVGTVIIALAMPIALLGYANLYMEENLKK